MKLTSAIAVYFIIWWTVLFAVLPFGVRKASEAGQQVAEGHDAGAPVAPRLGRKAMLTTAIASVAFALVYVVMANNWLETLDLPFMPKI